MHKRKLRTKKTVNNKLFNKKYLFWIIPLGIMMVPALAYLVWTLFAPWRAQTSQIERLDANAIKLEQVKNKLEKELPNLQKASFEKSCGESSTKFGRGTITCGSYVTILSDGMSYESMDSLHDKVKSVVESSTRSSYGSDYTIYDNEYKKGVFSGGSKLSSDKSSGCAVSENYYSTNHLYGDEFYGKTNMRDGIYRIDLSCREITPDFIKGYEVR